MRLSRALVRSFLPPRPKNAHKGTFGRVLIVAGSVGMAGAGVLCARGALQTGAGLVCLALPKSQQCVATAAVPEVLTLGLSESDGVLTASAVKEVLVFIEQFTPSVVLVGPGLSATPFTLPFLKKLTVPAVIDADALNALSQEKDFTAILGQRMPLICTPHPGEMQRLLRHAVPADEAGRIAAAQELSAYTGGISLLKGAGTVITDGQKVYINTTATSALAKAGSGDTLGGFIAGLWAQLGMAQGFDRQSGLKAAVCGVYLHGLCGKLAAQELTERCVLASDVAARLPQAMAYVLGRKEGKCCK